MTLGLNVFGNTDAGRFQSGSELARIALTQERRDRHTKREAYAQLWAKWG